MNKSDLVLWTIVAMVTMIFGIIMLLPPFTITFIAFGAIAMFADGIMWAAVALGMMND